MPNDLKYHLSQLAIEDLDSIWLYTFEKWSLAQANKYYNEIFDLIQVVCRNPEMGKILNGVKGNHRSAIVNSHMIIYKVEENQIWIDRILHQRMDIDAIIDL